MRNGDNIKNYAKTILASAERKKEEFKIDDVFYETAVIPAWDNYRIMNKIILIVTRNIMPIMIPAYSIYENLGDFDLKDDVSKIMEDERVLSILSKLGDIDEDDLGDIIELAYMFTAVSGERKSIDIDQLMEENPTHFYLIVFHFLRVNISPFFFKKIKEKKETKMKLG